MGKLTTHFVSIGGKPTQLLITAQSIKNSYYGNPRYLIQIWVFDETAQTGTLFTPKLKGYRSNKHKGYNIESYNIDEDIIFFVKAITKATNHN